MSRLKYTSAWSRPLKPALPETAAAMPQERRLGVMHRSNATARRRRAFLALAAALKFQNRRAGSEILKPPYRFGSRRRRSICRRRRSVAV